MRILHIIFSQQVAGAEKYLLDLLPGLKQHNIDCELICIIPNGDQHKFGWYCEAMNGRGIKTTIITGSKWNLLSVARKITRYAKSNRYNYIHSHLFKSDLIAVLISKLSRNKLFLISTRHGYQEKYFKKYISQPGTIWPNAYYYISKYVLLKFDQHIAVSKAISDLYYKLKLTKQPIHFIHHGIDINTQIELNGSYRISNPQLIVVGRIELIKGHQYLVRIMPDLVREFPDLKLLILGNGSEKENLIQLARQLNVSGNIEFMGFIKDPHCYIANSDIIVLPSSFEPFGLVYIEAFALKVPVIAFDVSACNEIIEHNITGILVPLNDCSALKEKIITLLKCPKERERIANNAYARYLNHFNTSRMVNETAQWYQSLIYNK